MFKSISKYSEIKLVGKQRNTSITTFKEIKITHTNPLIKIELSKVI